MKNILSILILSFSACVYTGCTDLEEDPKGLLAPEAFFKTPGDVEAAVMGAYAEWVNTDVEKSYFLALMLRSDMVDIGDRNTLGDRVAINEFSMDANNTLTRNTWERLYQCISAANTAIKGARDISADENTKNELEAKGRFIRAFTYFHLVRAFGDIPYVDAPIESAEVLDAIDKSSEAEIYQHIIADLIFAKEHLAAQNPSGVRNIGTQGSAATVLADVYLTLKQFANAATEARFVIDNAGSFNYQLANNYQDLFNADIVPTLKEPILIMEHNNILRPMDGMVNLTRIRDYAPRSLSVNVPALEVYNSWDERDYRRDVSFEDSVVIKGVKTALVDTPFRVRRPHIAKYFRYPGPQDGGDDRASDHHYSLYRYAEVLLIAAEAIAESEGATEEAIGYINQIRARARFNGTTVTDFPADIAPGISTADFIQAVRDERRLELAFEFKRWFDIKRWGILEEAFTLPGSLEPHAVDPARDYLFPIPQKEIDVTNISQNPGY